MANLMKKVSSFLLALVMVLVMVPAVTAPAFAAEGDAFELSINGVATGKTISKTWMEENAMEAQIFPFASKQGGEWTYVVAQGPSIEAVLSEALGIDSLQDLSDASINWNNEAGVAQGKSDLSVSDLVLMTECFKLIDENGLDVTSGFKGEPTKDVKVSALDGAASVTPIVATKEKAYPTYEEAKDALDNNTWSAGATTLMRPYVGGTLTKDLFLKKDGTVDAKGVNFTGKFSIVDQPYMDIKLPVSLEIGAMTFTSTVSKQAKMPFALTDDEVELLYGAATWSSSDEEVATVDQDGNVTPAGKIGTCTITAKMAKGNTLGKCSVTVDKKAFTPKVPASFNATNVKTKSAKLTWKKSVDATGYKVYRSTKKTSGYKLVKTTAATSYTNKSLSKNKTYYYKVKAYRDYNGTTLYSGYTAVKSVKIKK